MHPDQATAGVHIGSPDHHAVIDSMIGDVLRNLKTYLGANEGGERFQQLERRARELRHYLRDHARHEGVSARRIFLIREALLGRRLAWQHLASLIPGHRCWTRAAPEAVPSWFENDVLVPLSGSLRAIEISSDND